MTGVAQILNFAPLTTTRVLVGILVCRTTVSMSAELNERINEIVA
jgi:hypothetical protein